MENVRRSHLAVVKVPEAGEGRWINSLDGKAWKRSSPDTVAFKGLACEMGVIPEPIARLIYEECHEDETFQMIHKRGGFTVQEALAALADIIERQRKYG